MISSNNGDGDRKLQLHDTAPADHDVPYSSEFVPPESFWLSNDSEFDWFNQTGYLERKESTKGNNNNNSSYSRSNSQKFTVNLKSKPAIIGLPKTQRNTHVDSNRRQCKMMNVRMFPKRSGSSGRTTVTMTEPSSPKVSCIGRVRSKRCSNRRKSAGSGSVSVSVSSAQQKKVNEQKTGTGIISRITSLFRSEHNRRRKGNKSSVKMNEQSENSYSRKNTVKPVSSEPASPPEDPPALGGMNRFASGRRSVTWTDEIDIAGRRSTD
ncbi:hypothetical protein QVD17_17621 [Tagetes erecta]|uniref:Uncharacterized protein n=1 Tax=Tagetes erecta TaxID=13708 RepID=A0AAD8KX81_TARER|nr:hypothetical protein QVD17_17621 [Tagetes erecta]